MTRRSLRVLLARATLPCALALLTAGAALAVELFPLDELRPGLRGEGLSVFAGDSISRFPVEIIDRIDGRAPHPLVLVRCLGEELARSGVSQGMSGSPVYIEGRWLGAIAFNFSYAKEPLALVTPAAAMLALAERATQTPRLGARSGAHEGGRHWTYLASDWSAAALPARLGAATPLPLAVGGLAPPALDALAERFRPAGLALMPLGAAAAGTAPTGAALAPGAAIAVELLRGPIATAAIGTLTHVDGDRVWAFGHPFLGEGPSELPLASARIHAVLPSLLNSFKLGSLGEPVGTLLSDGEAGICGRLGPVPALLPLHLTLSAGAERREADFALARHALLGPVIARLAVDGWLVGRLGDQELGTLALDLSLAPSGAAPLRLGERFAGRGAGAAAGAWLASLLALLADNPAGPVALDSLSLALEWQDALEPLSLHDLGLRSAALRAGEAWQLRLRLAQGEAGLQELALDFPDPQRAPVERLAGGTLAPGNYQLHVADGTSFERWNAARQPALYDIADQAGLLALLPRLAASDEWVIWLEAPGEDAVLGGAELSLPLRYRALAPLSRRGELLSAKEPRRIVALQRLPVAAGAAAEGHLALPVTVLDTPRRSKSR